MMTGANPTPYTMDEQPTSPGRLFLARAFAHWCVLHHGLNPEEVEAALSEPAGRDGPNVHHSHDGNAAHAGSANVEPRVRRRVRDSARLISELVAAGRLRSFARPLGGGEAVELKAGAWELDGYRARFASCAIDPKMPFDKDATPTHWLFVDLDGFNALTAESCGEARPTATVVSAVITGDNSATSAHPHAPAIATNPGQAPRFLRLPEVKARTGMSRSTIYNRICDEQFPAPRNLGGTISAWPESEIDRWIADRAR